MCELKINKLNYYSITICKTAEIFLLILLYWFNWFVEMCDETELIFIKLKLSNTGDISVEFHVVNIEKFVIFLLIVLRVMIKCERGLKNLWYLCWLYWYQWCNSLSLPLDHKQNYFHHTCVIFRKLTTSIPKSI